jgi:hypothetical protein
MKTLSLRSRAALTSAIRAPPPADELQDKIKDLTFWPTGNPGSSSGSPCGSVAVGGAEDPWIAVPGTAADQPVLAVTRYSCAAVAGVASVAVVPAVLCPLINIAVDVVEIPQGFGSKLSTDTTQSRECPSARACSWISLAQTAATAPCWPRAKPSS